MAWIIGNYSETLYRTLCSEFLLNETLFSSFKSNKRYRAILGSSDPFESTQFYKTIRNHPNVLNKMNEFVQMDQIGRPPQSPIQGISMDCIRYVNSLCYLEDHFGSLNDWNITEFGAGYGGLASVLMKMWNVNSYNIIDLPEAKALAAYHLKLLNQDSKIYSYEPPQELIDSRNRLFISEYALTEMDIDSIFTYMTTYIPPSSHFFIRCNLPTQSNKNKLINHLSNTHHILYNQPEFPPSRKPNSIIIGSPYQ